MADEKETNPEEDYKYSDIDHVTGPEEEEHGHISYNPPSYTEDGSPNRNTVLRNAIIALLIVGFLMLTYKILVGRFSQKKTAQPVQSTVPKTPSGMAENVPSIQKFTPPPPSGPAPSELEQKINALQLTEQHLREDVTTLTNQLTGVTTNIDELVSQMAKLNQTVTTLSETVSQQSEKIAALQVHPKIKHGRAHIGLAPRLPVYFIRAVIQGRAWIISQKGDTLSVRVGSIIPGYGKVSVIDPRLGRIKTKSGRIITFSQADS
jgi:intracellular multiplication protein IcmG